MRNSQEAVRVHLQLFEMRQELDLRQVSSGTFVKAPGAVHIRAGQPVRNSLVQQDRQTQVNPDKIKTLTVGGDQTDLPALRIPHHSPQ